MTKINDSSKNCLQSRNGTKSRGRGGGFFLAYEDLGRMFDYSFSACALKKKKKVEISSRKLILLFGQDQSTVTQ